MDLASPHFPVKTSFLAIVTVVCPIGGHQQHDIIQLFHGVDMERDGIQLFQPMSQFLQLLCHQNVP